MWLEYHRVRPQLPPQMPRKINRPTPIGPAQAFSTATLNRFLQIFVSRPMIYSSFSTIPFNFSESSLSWL